MMVMMVMMMMIIIIFHLCFKRFEINPISYPLETTDSTLLDIVKLTDCDKLAVRQHGYVIERLQILCEELRVVYAT